MYGSLILGRSRFTIEAVAGEPDAEHDGASELKGYWLIITEVDGDGDGLEVRVAVEPTVAEIVVASWREHLASCGREVVGDDALRELMDSEEDGTVRVVTPIGEAVANRAMKRHKRYGGAGARSRS